LYDLACIIPRRDGTSSTVPKPTKKDLITIGSCDADLGDIISSDSCILVLVPFFLLCIHEFLKRWIGLGSCMSLSQCTFKFKLRLSPWIVGNCRHEHLLSTLLTMNVVTSHNSLIPLGLGLVLGISVLKFDGSVFLYDATLHMIQT
jgi:hypothetical protein